MNCERRFSIVNNGCSSFGNQHKLGHPNCLDNNKYRVRRKVTVQIQYCAHEQRNVYLEGYWEVARLLDPNRCTYQPCVTRTRFFYLDHIPLNRYLKGTNVKKV